MKNIIKKFCLIVVSIIIASIAAVGATWLCLGDFSLRNVITRTIFGTLAGAGIVALVTFEQNHAQYVKEHGILGFARVVEYDDDEDDEEEYDKELDEEFLKKYVEYKRRDDKEMARYYAEDTSKYVYEYVKIGIFKTHVYTIVSFMMFLLLAATAMCSYFLDWGTEGVIKKISNNWGLSFGISLGMFHSWRVMLLDQLAEKSQEVTK